MNICSRCGEEVRYGRRGLTTGWLHREEKDHIPAFGVLASPEMAAHIEAEMDRPRTRVSSAAAKRCPTYQELWPLETYTTREHELERHRKSKKFREAEEREAEEDDDVEPEEIPEPEVRRTPVEPDSFPPRSGIKQVINAVERTEGWELRRLTKARGPRIGARGQVLSIADSVVLGARGPVGLDGTRRYAVASWHDGSFTAAFIGSGAAGQTAKMRPANSNALKAWIKEPP